MNIIGIEFNGRHLLLMLAGMLGLFGVMAFDKFHWVIYMFEEGPPDFSSGRIVRTLIIFAACLLLMFGLANGRRPTFSVDPFSQRFLPISAIVLGFVLTLFFTFLRIVAPHTFSVSTLEDGPIEWGSALLLFAACLVMLYVFIRALPTRDIHWFIKLSLLGLSGVFFVMGMEEVSWFQRVFDIATPTEFANNQQKEINLHNFATNYVENAYYFGAFVYLVVFPYMRLMLPEIERIRYFKIFVARPHIALLGAMAAAYNYDMWNIVFMQVAMLTSAVILAIYIWVSKNALDKALSVVALFLVLFPQWEYLQHGSLYMRSWEVTEYREFLMPLAFFIYTLDLAARNASFLFKRSDAGASVDS